MDSSSFREALLNWLGRTVDDSAYSRLLLRLDHDNNSTVHFSTFYDLVRNGKMKDIINSYMAGVLHVFLGVEIAICLLTI